MAEEKEDVTVEADIAALELDVKAVIAAIPKEDTTFRVIKDPGARQSPGWPVATLSGVSFEELHKAFRDPWVWGATVLGSKYKGQMVTEWGFAGLNQEWALAANWPSTKDVPKQRLVEWSLGGTGTDYDKFARWLGKRLGRPVTVTPTDVDCTLPRKLGVPETFAMKD